MGAWCVVGLVIVGVTVTVPLLPGSPIRSESPTRSGCRTAYGDVRVDPATEPARPAGDRQPDALPSQLGGRLGL